MDQQADVGHKDKTTAEKPLKGYYALELVGKDQSLWRRWRARFVARLKNKMQGFFGRRGPRGKTIEAEANEAIDSTVGSLQAMLARAAIENEKSKVEIEKLRAEIERTLAESRFTDAKTRESEAQAELLRAQARKLDLEVKVQQVQTATTVIEAMIAKGQLYIREDNNGVYVVAREALRLSANPTQEEPVIQPISTSDAERGKG